MNLTKYLKTQKNRRNTKSGQSIIEYTLLVAIAIAALFIFDFLIFKDNPFEAHFRNASSYIGGVLVSN